MKKIYSIFTLILISGFAFAQNTYDITFQVDMKGQTIDAAGVSVAGDFQDEAGFPADWTPGDIMMDDTDGDSIYAVTVQLPAGWFRYKLINGNSWNGVEGVPSIAQVGGGDDNRWFNVLKSDSLAPVTFGGAAPAGMIFIGLQADMREQLGLGNTVDTVDSLLAMDAIGSFPIHSWNVGNGCEMLDNDGDSIFRGYTYGMPNTSYEMKFRRHRDWDGTEESIASSLPCVSGSNRAVPAMTKDSTIGPVCYAKCDPCVATVIDTFEVTFRVDMKNEFFLNGPGSMVSIAGNFQDEAGGAGDWSPGDITLTDADNDSIFEVTLTLITADAVGGVYTFAYKYLNGSAWGTEEPVPSLCNVNGNREAAISGDTILPAFCFGACSEGCPQILPPINLTFRVDMTNEVPSGNGIHVAGDFMTAAGFPANWQKDTMEMSDPNGTGIYEYTVNLRPAEYQYKFVNGDQDADEEDGDFLAGGCGVSNGIGGFNRLADITGMLVDTILPVYIYNTCNISTIGLDEFANKTISFSVYPNPMRNDATVWFGNHENAYRVQLFDLTGKAVFDAANVMTNSLVLLKENLNSGIYILKVSDNAGFSSVEKLVVE